MRIDKHSLLLKEEANFSYFFPDSTHKTSKHSLDFIQILFLLLLFLFLAREIICDP